MFTFLMFACFLSINIYLKENNEERNCKSFIYIIHIPKHDNLNFSEIRDLVLNHREPFAKSIYAYIYLIC
jgi:hypothetical protein